MPDPECCKLQIVFKNKTGLCNSFHSKDQIPKVLTFGMDSAVNPIMVIL